MLKLSPSRTALVLIDLQEWILPFAGGQHSAADVVKRAAVLAQGFRDAHAPVFFGPRGLVGRFRRGIETAGG